jgi:hypothetical protein
MHGIVGLDAGWREGRRIGITFFANTDGSKSNNLDAELFSSK